MEIIFQLSPEKSQRNERPNGIYVRAHGEKAEWGGDVTVGQREDNRRPKRIRYRRVYAYHGDLFRNTELSAERSRRFVDFGIYTSAPVFERFARKQTRRRVVLQRGRPHVFSGVCRHQWNTLCEADR